MLKSIKKDATTLSKMPSKIKGMSPKKDIAKKRDAMIKKYEAKHGKLNKPSE